VLGNDYEGQVCSVAGALEEIGERWSILVIREVFYGRRKFSEMQRVLGVARNVLSNRLQRLVDLRILERRIYSERPERYEYFLTEKGLDLWPVLISLMYWGDKHMPQPGGPPARVVHKGCGGAVNDRRICERCGAQLGVREARTEISPELAAQLAAAAAGA
jgi:DNA-binding HxlR family transcriptional regulator